MADKAPTKHQMKMATLTAKRLMEEGDGLAANLAECFLHRAAVRREPINADHFVHLHWPSHDRTKMLLIQVVEERDEQWRALASEPAT